MPPPPFSLHPSNCQMSRSPGPKWLYTTSTTTANPLAWASLTNCLNAAGPPYPLSTAKMCAGLYPHDKSPANSAIGMTWIVLMPNRFKWPNLAVTLASFEVRFSASGDWLKVPTCNS